MARQMGEEGRATAALLLASVMWGANAVAQKIALAAGLGPAGINLGQFLLATMAVGVVFFKSIRANYQKGQWKTGLLLGTALFLGTRLQVTGMQYTTPSNSAFIIAMYVVLVPFVSWIFTKQRPGVITGVACVISLAGVAVLSLNPADGFSIGVGDAITLAGSFLFSCQIVGLALLSQRVHQTVLVFTQLAVSLLWAAAAFLVGGESLAGYANPAGLGAVLFLGILGCALCFFLQTYGQKRLSSTRASITMTPETLFASLFSVLLGYDVVSVRMIVGGILILTAISLPALWQYAAGKRAAAPHKK